MTSWRTIPNSARSPPQDRLPLVRLRERRRELVLALQGENALTRERVREIAEIQQAIKAIEAVIAD